MSKEIAEQYWEDGKMITIFETGLGEYEVEEIPMSEHEYLYGEPDPNDTGEYYTDFMPKVGGYNDD